MIRLFYLLCLSLTVASGPMGIAIAEEFSPGLTIAYERKQRDTGWGDTSADMTMILRSASGDESIRKMRTQTLEMPDDGDKSLIVFDEPRDVNGTALLSYFHPLTQDEQWLYLPALKRVKLIASRNKSGPFMGSEFSYEDTTSFEVKEYQYRLLNEEVLDDEPCFVVEQIPIDEFSGYSRQVLWIDKSHYRVRKTEFYDRKQSLLKVLTLSDYHQYLDKYWRAHHLLMENKQNGKSTLITVGDFTFQTGLNESDFNRNSLKRAR